MSNASLVRATLTGALGILLAGLACGGTSASRAPSPASADAARRYTQFAQCLRAHGANEPDPVMDDRGNPKWQVPLDNFTPAQKQPCVPLAQAAHQASELMPRQAVISADIGKERVLAQCMRQRGYPVQDPDPTTGVMTKPAGIDEQDPAVQAAEASCLKQAGIPAPR